MEKIIWVIGGDKQEIVEAQRRINSTGSMRALCMLSFDAVEKVVTDENRKEPSRITTPSLIILDYETELEGDFYTLSYLKSQRKLAGVPIFFMMNTKSEELDEECYARGATVVLHKPFSKAGVLRIERTAWQYEVTKKYEKMLQQQAGDLQDAKEILHLNQQLQSRNELLHHVFGRYFSDKLLDVILEHPEGSAVGGEKRELTVMMADLRGFTSISEGLESEVVTDLLNHFFSEMLDVITQYQGIVIEYLGDAILAVFGAPLESESQTSDAIAAAISMQNRMDLVNAYSREKGYPILEMGIGVHRGEVFIGNIGSEKMMRYNVIGKAVNECSRIESYSVGGQVLVSMETIQKAGCQVDIHNQMDIITKGIQQPVPVCEVVGIGGEHPCKLENVEFDILHNVTDQIVFNLYPIEGKLVMDTSMAAVLWQFSRKRAKVVMNQEEMKNLQVFSDVEIFAAAESGRAVFTNVYAKVVEKQDQVVTLHFTHVNKSFTAFANHVLEEDNGPSQEKTL